MKRKFSIALAAAAFSTSAMAVDLPVVGAVPVVSDLPVTNVLPVIGNGSLPVIGTLPGVPALPNLDAIPGLDALPVLGGGASPLAGLDVVNDLVATGSAMANPLVGSLTEAGSPVLQTLGSTLDALPAGTDLPLALPVPLP